jgi:hypothetical protein
LGSDQIFWGVKIPENAVAAAASGFLTERIHGAM